MGKDFSMYYLRNREILPHLTFEKIMGIRMISSFLGNLYFEKSFPIREILPHLPRNPSPFETVPGVEIA